MSVIYDAMPLWGSCSERRRAVRDGTAEPEDSHFWRMELEAVVQHSSYKSVRSAAARELFVMERKACAS